MEKLQSSSERNIMPPDLLRHYIDGRAKARFRTGETTYIPDPTLPDFKCFMWQNPDLPFHFEDHFADSSNHSILRSPTVRSRDGVIPASAGQTRIGFV